MSSGVANLCIIECVETKTKGALGTQLTDEEEDESLTHLQHLAAAVTRATHHLPPGRQDTSKLSHG